MLGASGEGVMGAPGRKDDHDFMTGDEIANFLRGPATGTGNRGRQALGRFIHDTFRGTSKPTVLDATACYEITSGSIVLSGCSER